MAIPDIPARPTLGIKPGKLPDRGILRICQHPGGCSERHSDFKVKKQILTKANPVFPMPGVLLMGWENFPGSC